jgi:hypothetical protein
MEQAFSARRPASAHVDQVFNEIGRDPRVARNVAADVPPVFFEHHTLIEIAAAERRP